MIRTDRHSLWRVAPVHRNAEGLLDLHGVRADLRDGAVTIVRIFDARNRYIELAGPRAPLALLGTVGGLRGAVRPVEGDLRHDGVGCGGDQTCERRCCRVVRNHDQLIAWIVAHFVRTVVRRRTRVDHMRWRRGLIAARDVEHFDRAVAVSDPYLAVIADQHPIRPGHVVIDLAVLDDRALELSMAAKSQESVAVGVDEIDRVVGPVAEGIETDRRINEADVERRERFGGDSAVVGDSDCCGSGKVVAIRRSSRCQPRHQPCGTGKGGSYACH